MIPKLICWLFGHQREELYFSGKYGTVYSPLVGEYQVPIMYPKELKECSRCGRKLDWRVEA